jgi:hypothetical protein
MPLAASARDSGKVVWQPSDDAQMKLNGRALKTWNVWLAEKKKGLILVLIVRRYLVIDTKEETVFEVPPTAFTKTGNNLEGELSFNEWKMIPADNWTIRDIGPAELIRFQLEDYGKTLELQLPHLPDMRWAY